MKKLVVGNLKMNLNFAEIADYLKIVNSKINSPHVVICPTSIYIPYFLNNNYRVGLQNIGWVDSGAYTGEISPKQASSMGISYAIIGHSERRHYFNESDELINQKIIAALKNELRVIVCVGETLEERESLKTESIIKTQVINALKNLKSQQLDEIIVAYEPIWAIGTNRTPSNQEIEKTLDYIKSTVNSYFNYSDIKVLYGGSVNEKNIEELNQIKNVDGYLVGGASTKPDSFFKIIEVALQE